MYLVTGSVGDTELTGSIYSRSENPPSFKGAPDTNSTYVWICDEFYEVETGGYVQAVDVRESGDSRAHEVPQISDLCYTQSKIDIYPKSPRDREEKRIAFEPPVPRGFATLDDAIEGAKEHIRTQFARLGVTRGRSRDRGHPV